MQSFSVQSGELTLRGVSFGRGDEVVIALHGWLDNCHSFLPLLNGINLQRKWYCLDFPGHGKSDWRSADAHYYFVDYVDDLYNFLKTLNLKKVHLVGHSMGAMVAGLFASCFSEMVQSVTMIEGVGVITTPSDEVVTQLRKSILQRYKLQTKTKRTYQSQTQIVNARALVSDLPRHLVEVLMRRNSKQVEAGWQIACDPRLKYHSGFRFDESQCIATIQALNVPVQLILGDHGYSFVRQNLDKYTIHYERLNVLKIAGGHHCHMQSPQACLHQINAFMLRNGQS